MTTQEFFAIASLTMELHQIDKRPDGASFLPKYKHYEVTIIRLNSNGLYSYACDTYYSARTEPTIEEVLDCLRSDCSVIDDCEDMADFLVQMGYVSGSSLGADRDDLEGRVRRGIAAYGACLNTREEMHTLLGDDYDAFMDTEFDA